MRDSEHGREAVPKQDPETLVLRGSPRPVVRFRRGLIVGITGGVATALVTLAWMALEPPSLRIGGDDGQGAEPPARSAPEALAKAPANYGDVPRLGPPLPGDLGRPILEHQRSLEDPPPGDLSETGPSAAEHGRTAAEDERARAHAAREAARTSSVVVELQGARAAQAGPQTSAPQTAAEAPSPAGERPRVAIGGSDSGDDSAEPLRDPPSPWTLSAGTVIGASLVTGLNSDLPGIVIAQVTEPVRDSATGRTVLIPQGARLVGRYDAVLTFGQRRALVAWQRLVLPDGSSIRLDDMPAADSSGYAGLEDRVDFHTWRLLQGIALSTLLGVGTEVGLGSGEGDLVRALRESAQHNAARAGERVTERNLDIQPTVRVRPGWPVRAVIHRDLVLRPWRG